LGLEVLRFLLGRLSTTNYLSLFLVELMMQLLNLKCTFTDPFLIFLNLLTKPVVELGKIPIISQLKLLDLLGKPANDSIFFLHHALDLF
jgi:hypothetical protein